MSSSCVAEGHRYSDVGQHAGRIPPFLERLVTILDSEDPSIIAFDRGTSSVGASLSLWSVSTCSAEWPLGSACHLFNYSCTKEK